jgi:O-antigen/teichoic acid export membrane protein
MSSSDTPSTRPSRIGRNVLAGSLSQVCMLVLALLTTPILVQGLGEAHYGLWQVALALGTWVGFVNMILSTSLIRFMGDAMGRAQWDEVGTAYHALQVWALGVAGLGALALLLGIPLFLRGLNLAPGEWLAARWVFAAQAGFTAFQILAAVEHGVLAAHQRLDLSYAVRTAGVLLQSGGAAAWVYAGHGVVAVAGWITAMQVLEWALAAVCAGRLQRHYPRVALTPALCLHWGQALLRFGGPLLLGYLAAQFYLPMSRILIARYRPLEEVAYFAVPLALAINVKTLATQISAALLPAISQTAGKQDHAALGELYLRGLRWAWLTIVPLIGLVGALGGPFVRVWINADFGRTITPLIVPLAIGVNVFYLSTVPQMVAQGMGRPLPWAWMIFGFGCVHVLLGWLWIPQRGALGAAEALLVSSAALVLALMAWVGSVLRIAWYRQLRVFDGRVVIGTLIIGAALTQAVGDRLLPLGTVVGYGLLGLVLFGLTARWWLPAQEHAWLVCQGQLLKSAFIGNRNR